MVLIVVALLVALVSPAPAFAQTSSPGSGSCVFGICDPGAWLRDLVPQIVASFLGGLISGIGGAIAQFPNDVNFITRTPEKLSYDNKLVKDFVDATQALGYGLIAVVTLIAGFNVMFRPYLGSSYAGALELAPRVVLGAILVNTAPRWGRLAIDVNNAACGVFGGGAVCGEHYSSEQCLPRQFRSWLSDLASTLPRTCLQAPRPGSSNRFWASPSVRSCSRFQG